MSCDKQVKTIVPGMLLASLIPIGKYPNNSTFIRTVIRIALSKCVRVNPESWDVLLEIVLIGRMHSAR